MINLVDNPAEKRYKTDPIFRSIVDQLRYSLRQYQYTPGELREAVILAATMHEMTHIRPMFYVGGHFDEQ